MPSAERIDPGTADENSRMENHPRPGDPDFGSTIPADGKPILAGRYRVLRKLGEGGMGEVYLTEDQKLDGKLFAIKTPPTILARNARAVEVLKKEALRAMELSHPHIVTVRSFEETVEGVFIIMDYVDGETLEELLSRQGTLDEEELLRIFHPIAEALDYAHARGVIHRDLKPSNIMIASDGTAFIMDFGIACEAKETLTRFTGKETTSGTLPYMSPEQVRGKRPEPAQDVYSLAATMYECLVGHPPFHRGDLYYQIINESPETPANVASPLMSWILRGLAKEAEGRHGSCSVLVRNDQKLEGNKAKLAESPRPVAKISPRRSTSAPAIAARPPAMASPVVEIPPVPAIQPKKETDARHSSIAGKSLGVLVVLVMIAVAVTVFLQQADTGPSTSPRTAPSKSRMVEMESRGGPRPSSVSSGNAAPDEPAQPPWQLDLGGGAAMSFVAIPAGTFQMGSDDGDSDESPPHRVTISSFWLQTTEVTQAQWMEVMGENRSRFKGDELPVENVSWEDCREFCRKLTARERQNGTLQPGEEFRLPTEAEWEYACRADPTGKSMRKYCFGDAVSELGRYAWYRSNSGDKTHPVGQKDKNAWGLYDMHGNVWEWCWDLYDSGYYSSSPTDNPTGPRSGSYRVYRGGGWYNVPSNLRCANRDPYNPAYRYYGIGFRVLAVRL